MRELFEIQTTKEYERINNVFPQVDFKLEDNWGSYGIAKSLMSKPVDVPVTFTFRLEKRSPLTDVLSQSFIAARGLLISSRFSELLNKWTLKNIEQIKAVVKDAKGKEHQYFWIHPTVDFLRSIDYQRTRFIVRDNVTQNVISNFKVGNFKELYDRVMKITADKGVKPSEILYVKDSWCFESDIIFTDVLGRKIFVSRELKNELEKSNITGLDIINDGIAIEM